MFTIRRTLHCIFVYLALTSSATWAVTSQCKDIDTVSCQLIEAAKPDMCSDPVISQDACRRYCGLCPVQCVTCKRVVNDMSQCQDVITCHENETCYAVEVRDDAGLLHGFTGGCIQKDLCKAGQAAGLLQGHIFGSHNQSSSTHQSQQSAIIGRRGRQVHTPANLTCCGTNTCNKPIQTIPATSSTTLKTTTLHHHATTTLRPPTTHRPHATTTHCANDHQDCNIFPRFYCNFNANHCRQTCGKC
ncbi:uncharacterized protein LOC128216759 [Mya arenaria]|uniref:uncharacterized protein LOC128216759 n=1 Tax=Mya arenaria TaxID=6604 RepID=UPI0022E81858|nr:uncharacterized protein LOC128216759 [Mya arenaria]